MRDGRKIGKSIDWITIILFLTLVIMGWLFQYSARYDDVLEQGIFQLKGPDGSSLYYEAGKQFLWMLICLVLIGAIMVVDFKIYYSSAYIIFAIILLTLVAVLFLGTVENGARSWFDLGFMRLQPSEFGKFATALALARYLSDTRPKYNFSLNTYMTLISKFLGMSTAIVHIRVLWDELVAAAIFLLPAVLIVIQGDAGSALVYAGFIMVLYADGLPGFVPASIVLAILAFTAGQLFEHAYVFIAIGVGCIVVFVFLRKSIENILAMIFTATFLTLVVIGSSYAISKLKPHQRTRITVLFGEEQRLLDQIFDWRSKISVARDSGKTDEAKALRVELDSIRQQYWDLLGGAAYNINNSELAISYGGAWGQGYMEGILTKGDHVPEQHTDFIYSTIGEELGFFGTFTVIILFVAFMYRLIYLAERQKSHFAKIYGYSVVAIIFMHFLINIGMTIRLFPVVGIPLPFYSYGGSSLISFTILLFIFLKLDMHRSQVLAR